MTLPSPSLGKFVKDVGGYAAIVFVLLYLFYNQLGYMTSKLEVIVPKIEAVQVEHMQMRNDNEELKEELIRESRRQTIIQQQTCINTAPTKATASKCIVPE